MILKAIKTSTVIVSGLININCLLNGAGVVFAGSPLKCLFLIVFQVSVKD